MKRIASFVGLLAFSAVANSAVKFNEFFINPAGTTTDDAREYFELKTTAPNESLVGVTLLVIEGEGASAGIIDQAIDLGVQSPNASGSNSMYLLRATTDPLFPGPNGNTVIAIHNFTPDIENGANTYVLVRGFSGAVGTDLDTDNNGTLDVLPWTSVDDAVGYLDSTTTGEFSYAAQIGGVDFPFAGFTPEAWALLPGGVGAVMRLANIEAGSGLLWGPWPLFFNTTGTLTGQYSIANSAGAILPGNASWTLTPGSDNLGLTSLINPTNAAIVSGFGTLLGGSVSSLNSSDDNKYAILSDEFSTDAKLNITTTITGTISDLNVLAETSTSRENMVQFIYVLDPVSGDPVEPALDIRAVTLADDAYSVDVPNASNYRAGDNSIKFQIAFAPSESYLDAPDWVCFIDRFAFEVTP